MEKEKMKLKYKYIGILGFAFFGILMLWQVYNNYCPLMLKELLADKIPEETERMYIIGIIMALDNLVALFMLPIFGHLSDKTKTRFGKRIPYIIVGMILVTVIFPLIFVAYYNNSLIGLIITMILFLLIMQMYRNPAVALMPDITPKPLRSRANGIINLVGYFGPITVGLMVMFINHTKDSWIVFLVSTICIVLTAIILFVFIKENKIIKESKDLLELGEKYCEAEEAISDEKPLSKKDKKNLVLMLVSIFLWFMSFNAIETFLSTYCDMVLNQQKLSGTATIILTISSVITFIPGGIISTKIGRKLTVVIGLIFTTLGMTVCGVFGSVGLIPLFLLGVGFAGIGWALINVNSYPMIIELCTQNKIGVYTGYYYTASMIAQTITPILIGFIISFIIKDVKVLFIYSAILMFIALLVFLFVGIKAKKPIDNNSIFENFDN